MPTFYAFLCACLWIARVVTCHPRNCRGKRKCNRSRNHFAGLLVGVVHSGTECSLNLALDEFVLVRASSFQHGHLLVQRIELLGITLIQSVVEVTLTFVKAKAHGVHLVGLNVVQVTSSLVQAEA